VLRGLFVTGTGTAVGKTVVAAALMRRLGSGARRGRVRYWKPVQTGIERDDDTSTVRRLSGCRARDLLDEGVRLERPLSPHIAARLAGRRIELDELLHIAARQPRTVRWIVEGAGGVMVPLNDAQFVIDLIGALRLPALVVASSRLGTINHTLLTLAALRERSIRVAGVVMVGPNNRDNRAAIERFGGVEVLGELPMRRPLTPGAIRRWAFEDLDPGKVLNAWFR
jgi:dethiobiotin synthase